MRPYAQDGEKEEALSGNMVIPFSQTLSAALPSRPNGAEREVALSYQPIDMRLCHSTLPLVKSRPGIPSILAIGASQTWATIVS